MSTLNTDLEQIKYDEDNLAANKVARFCYTDYAYEHDDFEGVTDFNAGNEQNIPVAIAEILKTNATIFDKGFRSQASSLPRMLVNHFFGRVSYNLNKAHDNLISLITVIKGYLGQPNGFASLDENGRIPYSQLPESAIEYLGNWNASTNTPTLTNGMEGATSGDFYIVKEAGTHDFGDGEIPFFINDRVIYNKQNKWERLISGSVRSVNNKQPNPTNGDVKITASDIDVSETNNTKLLSEIERINYESKLGQYWHTTLPLNSLKYREPVEGNGIVLISSDSTVAHANYYTTDLRSWNAIADLPSSDYLFIYNDGLWVASDCFGNNGLWYSEDGINWTQSNVTEGNFTEVVKNNEPMSNKWVVASKSSDKGVYYSDDGKTWTQSNIITGNFNAPLFTRDGGVVLTSRTDNIGVKYSADGGATWESTNISTGKYERPVYNGDRSLVLLYSQVEAHYLYAAQAVVTGIRNWSTVINTSAKWAKPTFSKLVPDAGITYPLDSSWTVGAYLTTNKGANWTKKINRFQGNLDPISLPLEVKGGNGSYYTDSSVLTNTEGVVLALDASNNWTLRAAGGYGQFYAEHNESKITQSTSGNTNSAHLNYLLKQAGSNIKISWAKFVLGAWLLQASDEKLYLSDITELKSVLAD